MDRVPIEATSRRFRYEGRLGKWLALFSVAGITVEFNTTDSGNSMVKVRSSKLDKTLAYGLSSSATTALERAVSRISASAAETASNTPPVSAEGIASSTNCRLAPPSDKPGLRTIPGLEHAKYRLHTIRPD